MGTILRTLLIICFVSSCSFGGLRKPINYDNACSILAGKRHYYRAFKNTNQKWGVPIHVQMAVIYYESSFQNRAKTPMRYFLGIIPLGRESSAFGYAQALDGTWADYKKSTGRSIARRSSIRDSTDFMGWYMTKTRKLTGVSLSDAKNQYLAYHADADSLKNLTGRITLTKQIEGIPFSLFYFDGYGKELSTYHLRTQYAGIGLEFR